jgi:DNA processing protein
MLTEKEITLLLLSRIKGVGHVTLRGLLDDVNTGLEISEIARMHPKIEKNLPSLKALQDSIYDEISHCLTHDVSIVSIFNPNFPLGIKTDPKGPLFIYMKGNQSLLSKSALAIIGTRKPDRKAREFTKRVSAYFSQKHIPIVSGLALGCDSISHEEVLNTDGFAIGVLGHGLHTITPRENIYLADRIISSRGLLLSQFPIGMEPTRYTFVERDRTQASLSKAVILVQSDIDGGSLHACRSAISMGKQLFALPPTGGMREDANSIIHNNPKRAMEILKCDSIDFSLVTAIKGKEDYGIIENLFLSDLSRDNRE